MDQVKYEEAAEEQEGKGKHVQHPKSRQNANASAAAEWKHAWRSL